MLDDLHPCPTCARHVRRSESRCPFCACALSLGDAPYRATPLGRLTRAATLGFGVALTTNVAACTPSRPPDTGDTAPIYGLPDAPADPDDAGRDR